MATRMQPVLRSFALRAMSGGGMYSSAEIVASSEQWRDICGVYFLIQQGQIVYVGQARQVYARLAVHARNKGPFDRVAVLQCEARDLDVLESLYIHELRPEWNGRVGEHMMAPISKRDLYKNREVQCA